MNKYLTLVIVITTTSFVSLGQEKKAKILYDDWPTTVNSNKDRLKNGDLTSYFVIIGTTWDHRAITYFFANGTDDITGNNERLAIRDAFSIWSASTNLAFYEVCTEQDADIVILWGTFNHGDAGPFDGVSGVLAHTLGGPPPNQFGNNAGDIHFDDSETWTLSTRSNNEQPIDIITVAAHEIGHALGLDHTTVNGSLMLADYTGSHRYLGNDDIGGIQSLYGTPGVNGVTGPNLVCTNATFTLNNSPANTSWSVSPSNLVTPSSGNGATANVTKVSNGNAIITYTNGCSTLSSLSFHTGPYSSSDYPITGPGSASCNSNVYYSIPTLSGVTSINWVWPSGWTYVAGQNTTNLSLRTNSSSGVVSVGVNNTCGQSGSYATKYTSVTGFCGFSAFSVYPNPVSSELTISFIDTTATDVVASTGQEFESSYEVKIYNQYQELIYSTRTSRRRLTISISNFPNGTYYLNVLNKEGILQRKIFVDKN